MQPFTVRNGYLDKEGREIRQIAISPYGLLRPVHHLDAIGTDKQTTVQILEQDDHLVRYSWMADRNMHLKSDYLRIDHFRLFGDKIERMKVDHTEFMKEKRIYGQGLDVFLSGRLPTNRSLPASKGWDGKLTLVDLRNIGLFREFFKFLSVAESDSIAKAAIIQPWAKTPISWKTATDWGMREPDTDATELYFKFKDGSWTDADLKWRGSLPADCIGALEMIYRPIPEGSAAIQIEWKLYRPTSFYTKDLNTDNLL